MKLSNLKNLIDGLLSPLAERQKDVIAKRYGLNGEPLTLAEIGDSYSVTRERIRQIENLAIVDLRKQIANNRDFKSCVDVLVKHLKNQGGIQREDLLVADFTKETSDLSGASLANYIRLVFDISGSAFYQIADKDNHSYWYLDTQSVKSAETLVKNLINTLKGKKEEVLTHKKFDSFFAQLTSKHNVNDKIALNFASLSKQFTINKFGDFGLSEWPEVNPKTSRDWAYLVLKKESRPMHFTEIASAINKVRNLKQTHPQTVHNELIKDERFVLVGRGTYGLKEFGILPGTAREVIEHFLKNKGPLQSRDLVKLILQQRQFKENTLLLNLQNRRFFKRMDDGRYTILS